MLRLGGSRIAQRTALLVRDDNLFCARRNAMAILTAAKRNKLPKSEFGEPGEDKYPMPDWQHAANAKSRAKQQLNRGKLSRDEYD
jgi:hypothetical protein